MLSYIQSIIHTIEWIYLAVLIAIFLLIIFLWLLTQILKHQYLQKIIWPPRHDIGAQKDMDDQESIKHIRQIGQQHEAARRWFSATMHGIHWLVYLRLQLIRRKLSKVPADFIAMTPSSLWLFENFHLLYRELKKFQAAGGSSRFSSLPIINHGKVKGYPRVYALAREMIACNHHQSGDSIRRLLVEYQKERELTTAELWAFQNTLSMCLLEEIILESKNILSSIESKKKAEARLRGIIPQILKKDVRLTDLLQKTFSAEQTEDHVFLAHIVHRLRELSVDDVDLAGWLNALHKQTSDSGSDWLIEIVNYEGRYEAAAEAVISTLITSLKSVGDLNWEEMFQTISQLDIVLRKDPDDAFKSMDARSKGQYRAVIEKLSVKYHLAETHVAQVVVELSENEFEKHGKQRKSHIGYFLIGKGFYLLLDALAGSSAMQRFYDKLVRVGRGALYFLSIVAITAGVLIFIYHFVIAADTHDQALIIILLLLLLIPISEVAIFLSNHIFTRLVKPKPLVSLDLTQAIPREFATFVVMPVILSHPEQVRTYARRLENHYLANRQDNLFFAILADYQDADSETTEADAPILSAGIEAINALNQAHPSSLPRFNLFFRPRKWNESQNCWMGWERKRGKLEVFNAFLCGEKQAEIDLVAGGIEQLPDIRYVITLDADTEILRDGAAELIGVMAHPLNRPVLDQKNKRISEGYAIVQSEIRTRISTRSASLFARFFSGQTGIDPYATIVSDVYQDLFNEGIYAGKGIYDLSVFHRFVGGVISENSVLSHDLLEGSLLRCAFASGIKLMDSCPASVIAFVKREHRWIRGDWQLLPWIFSRSRINGLSRWKMVDNLRRSLVRPALLMLIIGNAIIFPEFIWLWLIFAGFEPVFSIVSLLMSIIWQKIKTPTARFAKIVIIEQLTSIISRAVFSLVLLPYRSLIALDAITRTLYRLMFSRRKLLEWQTAESIEKSLIHKPIRYWRHMWLSWLPGLIVLSAAVLRFSPERFVFWSVLAALWLLSPWIAWLSSLKRQRSKSHGDDKQSAALRLTARRTWRYFEDFSTIENHWLSPDNVQIYPGPKNSNKTSPTNIGLQLLSVLSARDLGYISLISLIDKCEQVIETLQSLPKWHGHLYNWYNIRTLQVLYPRYVSTVDSGNFAVHLIALKQGLVQQKTQKPVRDSEIEGLADTLKLAGFPAEKIKTPADIDTIEEWTSYLDAVMRDITLVNKKAADSAGDSSSDEPDTTDTTVVWLAKAESSCQAYLNDVSRLQLAGRLSEQENLSEMAQKLNSEAINILRRIDLLTADIDQVTQAINFSKLYDTDYQLFAIGYNESSQNMDSGHYDLLASESRVTSFFAIARGEVPQKHWFILGRPLTIVKGIPACVSWSGSMFEYLMPNLVMKTPAGSVLQQSCLAAVLYQIKYARRHQMPWGISESQYYRFDTNSNYQYSAAGVRRLRLQASLKPAKVIAPYATMLAVNVLPSQALDNLDRLRELGVEGAYGFYEALDYNQPDSTNFRDFSLVKCFMAHHQGMSLVAMNNFINRNIMQRRFHSEPIVSAAEALLEEKRSSVVITLASRGYTINIDVSKLSEEPIESRICSQTNLVQPLAHVLSNNHYMVMLTSDGAGFSSCDDILINRWQPETIHDQNGSFIYVRNLSTNQKWSASYLPVQTQPDDFKAVFSHDKAEFIRRDGQIQTYTSIAISPLKNFEVRRVALTNYGKQPAVIELTTYQEVVADHYMADLMHPSFSKLFIETEYVAERHMLIAHRRKRGPEDKPRYVMHALLPESSLSNPVDFEIDRRKFIGRGGSMASPAVIDGGALMSNQAGFSKDSIMSLRTSINIPAGGKASLSFITGFCASRAEAMKLIYELNRPYSAADVFKLALTSSDLELKYLNITSRQLNAIQNLISYLYYPNLASRGSAEIISRLKLSQSGLWRYSISGDHPIILLQVSSIKELPVIKDVLLAYEYLRVNQVKADLVILNEEPTSYAQDLANRIRELTGNLKIFSYDDKKPSLFLLQKDHILDEEYDLLLAVSQLVLNGKSGLYGQELKQRPQPRTDVVKQKETAIYLPAGQKLDLSEYEKYQAAEGADLEYFNGLGGFAKDGTEYEIRLDNGRKTPMPWINVIANQTFGFLVSEIGAGYTWADNSRENKLTTWSNDPVLDPVAEALYIKDESSGGLTSPASLIPGYPGQYKVRHGYGYSVFSNTELALKQEMTLFVPAGDPVKLWLLSITNHGDQARQLSLTLSVEWVLGVVKSQTAPFIKTEWDEKARLLTARNLYNDSYRNQPAYIFSSEPVTSFSGNRKKFFGIGGSIRYPSGLTQENLSNEIGVGLDPCGVIQVRLELEPGETKEVSFGLGQEENLQQAEQMASQYREVSRVKAALEHVIENWHKQLRAVTIKTPDRALDILANGWLQYQVISCRLLARAAFYQCGGAMGFRDQLQDVLALLDLDPHRVRQQVLTCCSRQFIEGDVQHWWHPADGLGVRTRISDDLLWLPYVTAAYIEHTGDKDILEIEVPFITGDELSEDQAEMMIRPQVSDRVGSVYEHCLQAIDRACSMGVHGLPLMGGGDWNDGMNRVGIKGKGESVWLGWFLYNVLQRFIPIVRDQADQALCQQLTDTADDLQRNLERHAWDGEWYLRAFFDNGVPLGSKSNDECRIDSISQSWSVLSGGAGNIRALTALDSARRYLVHEENGISLLLTPPFDKTKNDPGYIKGYFPGIRENGGQYTHAAIWLAMAYAKVEKGSDAYQLLTMLNPIQTTSNVSSVSKYEKEPYVMAADISMGGSYTGKAGWSWYTGSAGWMYQAVMQSFLGISKKHDYLFIKPSVPASFKRYVVEYRHGDSLYEITVLNDPKFKRSAITVDGQPVEGSGFKLVDDGDVHNVECKVARN